MLYFLRSLSCFPGSGGGRGLYNTPSHPTCVSMDRKNTLNTVKLDYNKFPLITNKYNVAQFFVQIGCHQKKKYFLQNSVLGPLVSKLQKSKKFVFPENVSAEMEKKKCFLSNMIALAFSGKTNILDLYSMITSGPEADYSYNIVGQLLRPEK